MICTLCAAPIDLTIKHPDPWSFSVDHTSAIANGGDPYADENLEPAHLIHNIQKGTKPFWDGGPDMTLWITDEDP